MDPTLFTVAEAGRAIAEGRLSPIAMTEAYLERIDALDGELHSYVTVLHEAARAAAREIAAGRSRGPLHGVPIGLKDIYKTNGIRTTAGSRKKVRVTLRWTGLDSNPRFRAEMRFGGSAYNSRWLPG